MSLMRTTVIPLFYGVAFDGVTYAPPLRVWVRDSTRAKSWPVMHWTSLAVDLGKYGDGSATIEVPAGEYWLSESGLGITSPEYGFGVSFDVYWQDMTTPIFSGPVESVEIRETRQGQTVAFTCSTFWQHFLTRRIYVSTDGSKTDVPSSGADRALFLIMDATGFADPGTTPVTPTGYPGSTSRLNFGDWSVDLTTVSAPGSHGTTIALDVSDGRRMLEEVMDLLEQHDMALTLAESPAGTFTYTIDHAYQENDYSSSIVIDLRRGTSTSYVETIDYTGIENVVQIKGSGQGASQNQSWNKDSTSYTNYGNFEGSYTYDEADATAISDLKSSIANIYAGPVLSYSAGAVDQPGATFNSDYAIRDLVTIRGAAPARASTKQITGFKLSASGRQVKPAIVLGDPPRNYTQEVKKGAGLPMGRGRGQASKFKPVSGN